MHLLNNPENKDIRVFEIDFPEIVESKSRIILSKAELLATLGSTSTPFLERFDSIQEEGNESQDISTSMSSPSKAIAVADARIPNGYKIGNLTFLSMDIRNTDSVIEKLAAASFDWAAPTLIITECVLVGEY